MRQAKYFPNLFKAKYPILKGEDWVRTIDREDLTVFVDLGLKACDHGRLGGLAILKRRGREYMSAIGRRGAIASNSKRAWNKAMQDEIERLGD